MDKYIGFDIDSKKVVACVIEKGMAERYTTIRSEVASMRRFLARKRPEVHAYTLYSRSAAKRAFFTIR